MPKICYRPKEFKPESIVKIAHANKIIDEYSASGYELTLRQLYYQFVARDLIANTQKSYDNLGALINDARLAGLVDWQAIVDRTRNLSTHGSWTSPRAIVDACAKQFKYDPWDTQACYVEVWVEKDALSGVIERACETYRVPHFSCRGYTSASEMWMAGRRLAERSRNIKNGVQLPGGRSREVVVIHLGDHDPSGIDMTRDIQERLREFGRTQTIDIRRIALNMDQVQQYDPPPNPAKVTDSRFESYRQEHGEESWELDALEPSVIDALIQDEIATLIDQEAWDEVMEREEAARAQIAKLAKKLDND